jgi:hypothetical protein
LWEEERREDLGGGGGGGGEQSGNGRGDGADEGMLAEIKRAAEDTVREKCEDGNRRG